MVSITATLELNVKMGQNRGWSANGGNYRLIVFCGLDVEAPLARASSETNRERPITDRLRMQSRCSLGYRPGGRGGSGWGKNGFADSKSRAV